jgi:hypothetical protein
MGIIWSGRTQDNAAAWLETIYVTSTYSGLLLGSPNEEINQRIVQSALEQTGSLFSSPVYLVEPRFVVREYPPDYAGRIGEQHYPALPGFLSIGHFTSSETRDADDHGSSLTIVWFQNKAIVEGIDLQLDCLDWFAQARGFLY